MCHLHLDPDIKKKPDELDVFILNGGDQSRSIQRIHAVDVQDLRVIFIFLQ